MTIQPIWVLVYIIGALFFFVGIYIAVKLALKKTNLILRAIAIKQGVALGQFMSIEELHEYIVLNKDELGLSAPLDNSNPEYNKIKNRLINTGK